MTAIKTKLGARDRAFNVIFDRTPDVPETNVQRAIEFVMGEVLASAPANAEYLVGVASAGLSAERVVTDSSTIAWDLSTPGQAIASVIPGSVGLPTTSVDNTVPRFNGTGGALEDTALTIDDNSFLGSVAGVGVGGAVADATNRLSVNTPAVLFNRETDDIQVKLNKNAAADTASFLFQTGFSGRAEIGLIGDDDFQFKVSPDGASFFSGIIIDKDDGTVNIPIGLTIPVSAAPTVNANGEIALDTTVADFSHGLLRIYGGEEQFVISLPVAALSAPTDGYSITYNATNDEFELAPGGGGGGANTALSNLASVAINTTLLPGSDDGAGLGSGSFAFSDLFLASGGVANFANGDVTITHSSNLLTMAGGDLSLGTTAVLTTGTLEVGHASDATLSRPSAGNLAIEGRIIRTSGRETIWVPAVAMEPDPGAAGPSRASLLTGAGVLQQTLNFDPSTAERAQFGVAMPKSWDEGTVTFQYIWSHAATVTNFGVAFGMAATAFSDGDALDTAYASSLFSLDTGGTTDDIFISPESSAVTVGGTPAEGDFVMFRLTRNPADAGDTLAVDARLHGVKIFYTTNAANDT